MSHTILSFMGISQTRDSARPNAGIDTAGVHALIKRWIMKKGEGCYPMRINGSMGKINSGYQRMLFNL
jgi:hypothetical protein